MSRLERWSRLKRSVPRQEDAAPLHAEEPVDDLATEPNASPNNASPNEAEPPHDDPDAIQAPPEPGSLDHTLPDPATLEAGSDFSAFMAPGVSGTLRRQALKRLWATGNYNVRDGLDDYDADYNKLLKPMTSELAGKLRRWTHKVEEAVDKALDDNEPESPKELAAEEQINKKPATLEEDALATRPDSGKNVENTILDDQSDYLSSTKTKT